MDKTSTHQLIMTAHTAQASQATPASVMIFGCGYIGSALAERLMQAGIRVGALTRNPDKAEALRASGVDEVVVAPLHERDWHSLIKGDYEAVVNCVSSAGGGLEGYRLSYLTGQKRILEWAKNRPLKSYIYTSSSSVYPQDGGVMVDETADTAEAPATGQVLLESERCLLQSELSCPRYVLRLAGIYGPGRHFLLDQLRESDGPIPGRGDYHMNMIHRDDAVEAILRALAAVAPSGIYNICDSHPALKEAVLNFLADQLSLPAPDFDPDQISPRLKRRGGRMPDRRISNAKALQSLGWSPNFPSFREGYRPLIEE